MLLSAIVTAALASITAAKLKPRVDDYLVCLGLCNDQFSECIGTDADFPLVVVDIDITWYVTRNCQVHPDMMIIDLYRHRLINN